MKIKELKLEFEKKFGEVGLNVIRWPTEDVWLWFAQHYKAQTEEFEERIRKEKLKTLNKFNTGEDKLVNIMEFRKQQRDYFNSLSIESEEKK